jgi:hypothetical protein
MVTANTSALLRAHALSITVIYNRLHKQPIALDLAVY